MEWFILFIVVLVVSVTIGIYKGVLKGEKTRTILVELQNEFPSAQIHVSNEDQSFCVVDFETSTIVVGLDSPRGDLFNKEEPYRVDYEFSDIAAFEVQKDGTTIASTNRGSQALGVAVGALALGGIGAIVGGLSGSSTQQERVRRISLILKVRDNIQPLHNITFFNWEADKKGVKPTWPVVTMAISKVEKFAAHISNAIHASEAEYPVDGHKNEKFSMQSMTSQIKELWELKQKGVISEDEFKSAKDKIIS